MKFGIEEKLLVFQSLRDSGVPYLYFHLRVNCIAWLSSSSSFFSKLSYFSLLCTLYFRKSYHSLISIRAHVQRGHQYISLHCKVSGRKYMYMSAHPSPPQIPIKGQLHPATDLYYIWWFTMCDNILKTCGSVRYLQLQEWPLFLRHVHLKYKNSNFNQNIKCQKHYFYSFDENILKFYYFLSSPVISTSLSCWFSFFTN